MEIYFSSLAEKQFNKAPNEIKETVQEWVSSIMELGLVETRRLWGKGLHDEPLQGILRGVRSIRLNKAWRLYYTVEKDKPKVLQILRIDKHKY